MSGLVLLVHRLQRRLQRGVARAFRTWSRRPLEGERDELLASRNELLVRKLRARDAAKHDLLKAQRQAMLKLRDAALTAATRRLKVRSVGAAFRVWRVALDLSMRALMAESRRASEAALEEDLRASKAAREAFEDQAHDQRLDKLLRDVHRGLATLATLTAAGAWREWVLRTRRKRDAETQQMQEVKQ